MGMFTSFMGSPQLHRFHSLQELGDPELPRSAAPAVVPGSRRRHQPLIRAARAVCWSGNGVGIGEPTLRAVAREHVVGLSAPRVGLFCGPGVSGGPWAPGLAVRLPWSRLRVVFAVVRLDSYIGGMHACWPFSALQRSGHDRRCLRPIGAALSLRSLKTKSSTGTLVLGFCSWFWVWVWVLGSRPLVESRAMQRTCQPVC